MRGTGRSAFRRTMRVGAAAAVASVLTFAITSPGSAETARQAAPTTPFGPGTGSAIALVYKVNPLFGNLSFGITAGESVAGHQNTGSQAQSKAVNLGVIGVTLAGEGCKGAAPALSSDKQPQPVIVSSDDAGAAAGKSAVFGGGIAMFAQASKVPFAKAQTEVAPVGVPNGVEISGGKSTATSGIVKAGVREARAITQIGRVSLLGGLVTLDGMRWEAVQQTGGRDHQHRHVQPRLDQPPRRQHPPPRQRPRPAEDPQGRPGLAGPHDHRAGHPGRAGHRLRRPDEGRHRPVSGPRQHHQHAPGQPPEHP